MLRGISKLTLLLLIFIAMIGCRSVSQNDVVGTWVIDPSSRLELPADFRKAEAKFLLNQDGTFVCSEVPALFYFPGKFPARLESGNGTWRLVRQDGNQALQLVFQHIDRWNDGLPYGTILFISRNHLELFLGDPDERHVVDFSKQ